MFTSKLAKSLSLIFVFLSIISCAKGLNSTNGWSDFEKIQRHLTQTHHWGQKGEVSPNNGWAAYSTIRLDLGEEEYLKFKQQNGELSVSVNSKKSNLPKFQAVSIPQAGIFYSPKKSFDCRPVTLEGLGLNLELSLFFISQAFPEGPVPTTESSTKTASGGPTEIRFMQGLMRLKSRWDTKTKIKVIKHQQYFFEIYINSQSQPILLEWDGNKAEKVIRDNEHLQSWLPCWQGVQSSTGVIETNIPNHKDIENFGQIRASVISKTSKKLP